MIDVGGLLGLRPTCETSCHPTWDAARRAAGEQPSPHHRLRGFKCASCGGHRAKWRDSRGEVGGLVEDLASARAEVRRLRAAIEAHRRDHSPVGFSIHAAELRLWAALDPQEDS